MKLTTKIVLLVTILVCAYGEGNAQQYLYEIGPTAGAAFYSGDANNYAYFQKPQPVAGISLRRNFNFRTAVKLDFLAGKAAYEPLNENLPNAVAPASFRFVDMNAHLEYSFFSYSDSFDYKETRRFTPYIFTGLGVNVISSGTRIPYIPIGAGIKYKIFHRWSVGLEYSANMMLKDCVELGYGDPTLNDPYKANKSSIKNNDWISYLKFNLTFDFWERGCRCNKNR